MSLSLQIILMGYEIGITKAMCLYLQLENIRHLWLLFYLCVPQTQVMLQVFWKRFLLIFLNSTVNQYLPHGFLIGQDGEL